MADKVEQSAGSEYKTVAGDVENQAYKMLREQPGDKGAELAILNEVRQFEREHPDQIQKLKTQFESDNSWTSVSKWGVPEVNLDLSGASHISQIRIDDHRGTFANPPPFAIGIVNMDEQVAFKSPADSYHIGAVTDWAVLTNLKSNDQK